MLNYPPRCFTQYETNVGYHPRRTIVNTALRYGPGDDMPFKQAVKAGKRIGVQSTRNPGADHNPPPRPAINGYVWVFQLEGGESGWLREDALRYDHETAHLCWADGPASMDFQVGCGSPREKKKPRYTIGWKPKSGPYRRTVKSENVYLRYAVRSTAYHYLWKGDVVDVRWYHPLGWYCVKVVESRTAPEGAIGWVWARSIPRS